MNPICVVSSRFFVDSNLPTSLRTAIGVRTLILAVALLAHCPAMSFGNETPGDNKPPNRQVADKSRDGQQDLVLVDNGRPRATIVVPDSPDPWTTKAARWLQEYVERVTGAKLPIAPENGKTSGAVISIGHTKMAAQARIAQDDWKWDTARIVVRDDALFLIGRDETPLEQPAPIKPAVDEAIYLGSAGSLGARGTCKAVVGFLEEHCGVRWFLPAPDGELAPKRSTLAVPRGLDRTIVPVFAYSAGRDLYGVGTPASVANNFRTAVKLRTYGGHSYYSWLPAAKYFKEHPEYFALIDGKRTDERNHLCSSNPEVRNILIREIRKEFDRGYDWVQLGQEDDYARCECEQCEALDRYRGGLPPDWYEMYDQEGFERLRKAPCERLLLLHKAVADACLESHPNKTVHLLVYRQTLAPSEKFDRFGPNVVGEMCNINPQAIIPWKGKVRAFTSYLYCFDITLGLGMGLHTTPKQAAARIRYLRDENFIGIYQIPETNWGLQGPIYWTIAKTMGNPDLNPEQLVEEYCSGVFDEAAPAMSRFFNLLYKRDIVAVERSSAGDQHLFYYPASLCVELEPLLQAAETAARTERARMWVRLTREHFDYLKHVTFLLTAYQAFAANPSPANRSELLARREEFDRFRQRVIELDDAYTARWFPGYNQFASFLTANGENVYYIPWPQRREQFKRDGAKSRAIGFSGAGVIREPFSEN
ncbi:MAG: DUF4838 domain-containing protein [Pirellulales bacterium]|nr:DUF4838 domain-containing protein [Pirellulales bacterium]